MRIATVVVVVGLFAAACSNGEDSADQLACQKFRSMSADAVDGKLTDAEIRSELQGVDDWAEVGSPAVRDASTELLAAYTPPIAGEGTRAYRVRGLGEACETVGH